MTRRRGTAARWPRVAAAVTAAVVALLWSSPAAADTLPPGLAISDVKAESGTISFLVTPTNAAPGSTVDLSGLTVRAGDVELTATVSTTTRLSGAPTRLFIVVLDGGDRDDTDNFPAAQDAAAAVADTVPADVSLGLVMLGPGGPVTVLAPTRDRDAYRAAVAAQEPGGNWDPVDGLDTAREDIVNVLTAVERRLLLISDGMEANPSEWHSRVGASIGGSGIGLDIIAVGASGSGLTALRLISDAALGRLITTTDSASAVAAAVDSASAFAPTVAVSAGVPSAMSGQTAVLTVEAPGFTPFSTTVAFAVWDDAVVIQDPPFAWIPDWLVYVAALFVFAGVAVAILAVAWPRPESQKLIKQIVHFGPRRAVAATGAAPEPTTAIGRVTQTVLRASESVVRAGRLEERIAQRLERAGMKLRPHEWVAVGTGVPVGVGLLLALVGGFTGFVVGFALGLLGVVAYRLHRTARRARAFTEQLPDGLQLVIGSLRSGFSLSQALESLVRESPDPLASEFGRAIAEHRLGADLSDALDRLAERVGSEDLSWAIMAVRIQREVGGNLADVLQTSVDTMRERDRLRRQVRALSAEGRLSAWVLIGVPILISVFLATFRRSYLMPLVTDPRGIAMLLGAIVLFIVGVFWLTRVIKVEP